MLNLAILVILPALAVGDHCSGSLVCPAIAANVEAILDVRKMLGCCAHEACMPVVGSAQCSQKLTTRLQPCMQKDYGGNRAACMNEAVGHAVSAVCDHLWERCEGLRSLTMYLQLGQAVSGCPMREGMFGVSQVLAIILAPSLALPATLAAVFPPIIPNFISAETSTDLQLQASATVSTGIVLVGGNNLWQGNVFTQDPQGRWGAVCGNNWTNENAQVVCRQLGRSQAVKFYGSPSFAINPPVDGPGSRFGDLPFGFVYVLERVSCAGTESRLIDCPILPAAAVLSTCDATTVAGVECA